MRRLALCLAVVLATLAVAPPAFADGPIYVVQGGSGVASQNGAFRYVALSNGAGSTLLVKVYTAGTEVYGTMTLPGSWGTALIGNAGEAGQGLSHDGHTLVLASTSGPYAPSSKFLLVDPTHWKILKRITLPGSFTFDALSPDAWKMYLIQFTSSTNLTSYVVREYDLRTNRLLPGKIAARDEGGDESKMDGYAMTRTTSADGRWVYTLYQKPSGMPFIHALDTVRGVAHCIDLPWSKKGDLYNVVLSLRNDDRTLAVHWRSGRPLLNVAVGSWRISTPETASFPWTWTGAGIGGALALLAAGVLLLRRGRGKKVEQHSGQELGLA